jgi:hypothetical protein
MRRIATLTLVAAVVLLSGCFDIYEHISRDQNGLVDVYFRVSFSRSMMEMATSMSETPRAFSPDDLFGEQDAATSEILSTFGGKFERIDTSAELGAWTEFAINPKLKPHLDLMKARSSPLVPDISSNQIVITFNGAGENPDYQQTYDQILSSFKFRLTISKSVMPTVSRAVVSTAEIDFKPIVVSLPDEFLIDIPVSYLMQSTGKVEIVITR